MLSLYSLPGVAGRKPQPFEMSTHMSMCTCRYGDRVSDYLDVSKESKERSETQTQSEDRQCGKSSRESETDAVLWAPKLEEETMTQGM